MLAGTEFYCTHAFADGSWCIRIKEKTRRRVGPGAVLSHLLLSFSIIYFFHFLLALSIFLPLHSFPFYQNSHLSISRPDVVEVNFLYVLILYYMYFFS